MNQAFQSTLTTTRMQAPSRPLIIDGDESVLNQLIILRKRNPYNIAEEQYNANAKPADFLGLDFLEFNALDEDLLNTDELWVTALDETDYMLADVLYDMLDQLNKAIMAIFQDELFRQNQLLLQEEDASKYGFDPDTGIRLDKQDQSWIFQRNDNNGNNYVKLRMNDNYGYDITLKQGDFEIYGYKLGVDTNNTIDIIQSN